MKKLIPRRIAAAFNLNEPVALGVDESSWIRHRLTDGLFREVDEEYLNTMHLFVSEVYCGTTEKEDCRVIAGAVNACPIQEFCPIFKGDEYMLFPDTLIYSYMHSKDALGPMRYLFDRLSDIFSRIMYINPQTQKNSGSDISDILHIASYVIKELRGLQKDMVLLKGGFLK